jgi:hypothetical protein
MDKTWMRAGSALKERGLLEVALERTGVHERQQEST